MKKIALLSLCASAVLLAGGYKIPETSTNSVALGGANIAHVSSADAAYDNPANMIFMTDENHMEADLMYIGLSATKFDGTVSGTGPYDLKSEQQTFIIPSLHYVSPKLGENDIRFGFSMVVPGGLTREWSGQPAKTVAEEFTLKVIEFNPSVAFAITDKLAMAIGFRVLYTEGVVKSDGAAVIGGALNTLSRDMEGDSIDFGYNLALAYKPTKELEFGLTYRSNVDLTTKGTAKLATSYDPYAGAVPNTYDGHARVTVPLPATLAIAAAYTFPTKATVEFVYERAYWSSYESLQFEYDGTPNVATAVFGANIDKSWNDVNTFRLGITQELDTLTLMAGFVIDESPTPERTLNFESPGSDSMSVSFGGRYAINDKLDVGLSALYSMKEDRTINNNDSGLDGEFTDSNALLISVGLGYKF
jgi:long-chain fatty acid transport protein